MTRLVGIALLCIACGGSEFAAKSDGVAGEAGESSTGGDAGEPSRGGSDSGGESGEAGAESGGTTATGGTDAGSGGSAGMPSGGSGGAGMGGTDGGASGSAGSAGSGGMPPSGDLTDRCERKLTGRLRDFQPTYMGQMGHPDFEPQYTKAPGNEAQYINMYFNQVDMGIVAPELGSDRKPRYTGPATGTWTTNGESHFNQWFRDDPSVNMGIDYTLEFAPPQPGGMFTFDRAPFLPIPDGASCPVQPQTPCLLGNSRNYPNNNYALTFELHVTFRYREGTRFIFNGDDDVWVFVNGQRVVDLGGIHTRLTGEASFAGLTIGQDYALDFFWAERHVTAANFKIETNLEVVDCGEPGI